MYNVDAVVVVIDPIKGAQVDSAQKHRYCDALEWLEPCVYTGLVFEVTDKRTHRALAHKRMP